MIFEIPISVTSAPTDGEITLDVELDGNTYRLQFSYAECSQLWYMSIFLQTNTVSQPIAYGLACVTGVPLLADVQVSDRPLGQLIFQGAYDAGRNDLGTFVKLLYYDVAELTTMGLA